MKQSLKELTAIIQKKIAEVEVLKFNLPCENVLYVFPTNFEMDVLSLNKQGYLTEFEVKVSKSDFKADKKKKFKSHWYESGNETMCPNRFYYVCPEGLISIEELPTYAGLIYYSEQGLTTIRKAPMLHKKQKERKGVLEKFCRLLSERMYLGSARLTYNNRKNKERIQEIKNQPNTGL